MKVFHIGLKVRIALEGRGVLNKILPLEEGEFGKGGDISMLDEVDPRFRLNLLKHTVREAMLCM